MSVYDWFGSVAMLPSATALAAPAESLFGRHEALWGCAALVVVVTGAVLFVPGVRNLTRRMHEVAKAVALAASASSADAEGAAGRLG